MYTCISSTRNGIDAIKYALGVKGKGHNGHKERNLMIGSVNMVDSDIMSYSDQMQIFWNMASDQHEVQVRRIIASLSENEGDPKNPNDVLRFMNICYEFIETYYPDRQCLICLQSDGDSGYLHGHMILNDCDMLTGKGCSREQQKFWYIKKHFDEIAEKYIGELDYGQNKARGRSSQYERATVQGKIEKPSWKDDLRDRIYAAMDIAVDWNNYVELLEESGVQAVYHENKGKYDDYITYELVDNEKYKDKEGKLPSGHKWLRSKHHKLFSHTEYEKLEDLDEIFQQNYETIITQYGINAVENFDEDDFDEDDFDEEDEGQQPVDNFKSLVDLYKSQFDENTPSLFEIVEKQIEKEDQDQANDYKVLTPVTALNMDDLDELLIEKSQEMSDQKKEAIKKKNDLVERITAEGLRIIKENEDKGLKDSIDEIFNKDQ